MDGSEEAKTKLEQLLIQGGFEDFKWIDPHQIVVAQWVRMKCMFGCSNYGKAACCPPNVPTVAECERFFQEYKQALILHFEGQMENPEDRHAWSKEINLKLLDVEKRIFLSGYEKTFLLPMDTCEICQECTGDKTACQHPKLARPPPEALAVDVFSTARHFGYPIEVLKDYSESMNRYAILLIE